MGEVYRAELLEQKIVWHPLYRNQFPPALSGSPQSALSPQAGSVRTLLRSKSRRSMPEDGRKDRVQNPNRNRRDNQPDDERVPDRCPQQVHRIRMAGMKKALDLGGADAQTPGAKQYLACSYKWNK